jgi:threonine dehydrogenase-like Zn-dependent dehydrogenase
MALTWCSKLWVTCPPTNRPSASFWQAVSSAASGFPQYEQAPVGFGSLFGPNITLTGGPAPVRAYIQTLFPDIINGTVEPGKVFDREIVLDETPDGYRAMDDRAALKVLVRL